jgi:hypothetical protein
MVDVAQQLADLVHPDRFGLCVGRYVQKPRRCVSQLGDLRRRE